jgi:hypothetical protein
LQNSISRKQPIPGESRGWAIKEDLCREATAEKRMNETFERLEA